MTQETKTTIFPYTTLFRSEKYGGEIRYFREIKYVLRAASKNHERNHRKLLIVDGRVSYIGSANISAEFYRSEEHTSELQSLTNLVCRLLLEKKKKKKYYIV